MLADRHRDDPSAANRRSRDHHPRVLIADRADDNRPAAERVPVHGRNEPVGVGGWDDMWGKAGQVEKARGSYAKAIQLWGQLAHSNEKLPWVRYYLAESYYLLAHWLGDRGDFSDAVEQLRHAQDELQKVLNQDEFHTEARTLLGTVRKYRKEVEAKVERPRP